MPICPDCEQETRKAMPSGFAFCGRCKRWVYAVYEGEAAPEPYTGRPADWVLIDREQRASEAQELRERYRG